MISFAGIDLTPPAAGHTIAAEYWHSHCIDEWEHQAYLMADIQHLPGPYPPVRRPPRIGTLHWPTGASRWGICHLVATGPQRAAIEMLLGTAPTAQPLVFNDGTTSITTSMYLLAPRPIVQHGANEWYLLTLVDDRWWWYQSGDNFPSSFGSWTNLITSLFSAVGVSPTIDSIPSEYLTPNPDRWNTGRPSIPLMIDAACRQVGMRVVRRLDGTVHVQNYTTSSTEDTNRWNSVFGSVLAGGRLTGAALGRSCPASVDTLFFDDTTVNTTLTSLAITDFDGVAGVAGKSARIDADPIPANVTQRNDYATQSAIDYYSWFLAKTDATMRAVLSINSTGLDDCVEWDQWADGRMVTRIVRPEWSDRNIYGTETESPTAEGSAPEFMDECVNGFLIRLRATIFLDADGLQQTNYVLDASYGIRCSESGSGLSGSGAAGGSGPTPTEPQGDYPVAFNAVTNVCPPPLCGDQVGDVVIKLTNINNLCFLKADGSAVSRTTYEDLFGLYQTTFGTGDGSTTFNLPTIADPVTGLSYFVRAFPPTLAIQKQQIMVLARGIVTDPDCEEDPVDCCPGQSGSPVDQELCCGGNEVSDTIAFAIEGPFLPGSCGTCMTSAMMMRPDPQTFFWGFTSTAPMDGCLSSLEITLYCSEGEWRIAGVLQAVGSGIPIYFDIPTDEIDGVFVGEIVIPGCEATAVVAVDNPCPGPTGGELDCCPGVKHETLNLALSGGLGDVSLVWNGTVWTGSAFLGGCTVFFEYNTDCTLSYYCNDGSDPHVRIAAGCASGCVITCGPPFSSGVHRFQAPLLPLECFCSFGTVTGTVTST